MPEHDKKDTKKHFPMGSRVPWVVRSRGPGNDFFPANDYMRPDSKSTC